MDKLSLKNLEFKKEIIEDYRMSYLSRQISIEGYKEVINGKAKFGIFGDGKEIAQIALSRYLKPGDWKAGYYRDQTIALAMKSVKTYQLFSQLYGDINNKSQSAGRQMVNHFNTRNIKDNIWQDLLSSFNIASDISAIASQMPKSLGLAYASKLFKENKLLKKYKKFSDNGNEICIATIGNGGCAEGLFWETLNAAALIQVPLVICIWDDNYSVSVEHDKQIAKNDIYLLLKGFVRDEDKKGINLYQAAGWDYLSLRNIYLNAIKNARDYHIPAVIHIKDLTQPLGHSTSGSQKRYKSETRLEYEKKIDCLSKFRQFILENNIMKDFEIDNLEKDISNFVEKQKSYAWNMHINLINKEWNDLKKITDKLSSHDLKKKVLIYFEKFESNIVNNRKNILNITNILINENDINKKDYDILKDFYKSKKKTYDNIYDNYIYCEDKSVNFKEIKPIFSQKFLNAHEILNIYFDDLLKKNDLIFMIGEDIGALGGVNLAFKGLMKKYGFLRCGDTGVREATILGQGIGAALRGLRPIVDIQYIDYIFFCFQGLIDELACLFYRSAGIQTAPVIVRTKGHRLEGIWHSGSPMGLLLNGLNGIYICVPRNIISAIGMYNTLFKLNNPAIMIECLNGYRKKEALADNLSQIQIPLGKIEIIQSGSDLTLVTYGACVSLAQKACEFLKNISVEIIDIRFLLPFDLEKDILNSIKKTNALIILDEDMPGGASSYILDQILIKQKGFQYLEIEPLTITAKNHRPAYGIDGDYFSKPNIDDITNQIKDMISIREPKIRKWDSY